MTEITEPAEPTERPRWLVTVEGVDVPARAAVLSHIHATFGFNVIIDNDRCPSSLMLLLHRLKALARLPASRHVLLSGAWGLRAPREAAMQDLHADLGAALVGALGIPDDTRHLMISLRADADEAFEAALHHLGERDTTLQDVKRAAPPPPSPFGTHVVDLECPRYVADNPAELEALKSKVTAAVRRTLGLKAA